MTARLADHFVAAYGAPDRARARPVAEAEIAYTTDLCAGISLGKVVAVSREIDARGELREAFRVIDRPTRRPRVAPGKLDAPLGLGHECRV